VRSKAAFLMGAGTAFFLDPQQGKRRRRLIVDRTFGFLRRGRRAAIRKVKFAGGHLQGLLALTRHLRRRSDVATDDRTVEQRIRSDAFRDAGITTSDVEVAVENGIAKLTGSIDNTSLADDLIARVRKVPGVREVSAELQVARA
jgi:hypothetical protein